MSNTQPGDLWVIGNHRLLCGDSTDPASVDRLMNGERAAALVTSPPYGQQRTYIGGIGDWDTLMSGVFADHLPMTENGQLLINLGPIYRNSELILYWENWQKFMRSQGWRFTDLYIWDKVHGFPGDWHGRLAPAHEYIFHFNQKVRRPNKTVPKRPENITANGRTSGLRRADGHHQHRRRSDRAGLNTHKIPDSVIRLLRFNKSTKHPAVYPVCLPAALIDAYTDPGEIIFEPFSGYGTTILAAEQLARRCYAIELQPSYVDDALARIQRETKIVPYRANDGSLFGGADWFDVRLRISFDVMATGHGADLRGDSNRLGAPGRELGETLSHLSDSTFKDGADGSFWDAVEPAASQSSGAISARG